MLGRLFFPSIIIEHDYEKYYICISITKFIPF